MVSDFFIDTVTIVYVSSSRGSGGEAVRTYTTAYDLVGSFQENSGDKSYSGNVQAYRKTYTFYTDYTTAITPTTCAVKFNGVNYEITNVVSPFYHHTEIRLRDRTT